MLLLVRANAHVLGYNRDDMVLSNWAIERNWLLKVRQSVGTDWTGRRERVESIEIEESLCCLLSVYCDLAKLRLDANGSRRMGDSSGGPKKQDGIPVSTVPSS